MIYLSIFILLFFCPSAGHARESVDELLHFSKKQEEVLIVKVNSADSAVLEDGRRIKLIGIEAKDHFYP